VQLRDVLHGTVDQGDALVAIEHSLEMAKTADWIVDMGFEGGEEVVARARPSRSPATRRPTPDGI
jgi:excinuclease ABC subunit A